MKLKELYKHYKGYDIVVFGRPLKQKTIPFTLLPKGKPLMECEVVDFRVEEKEKEIPHFKLTDEGIKHYKTEHIKGNVYVYVR